MTLPWTPKNKEAAAVSAIPDRIERKPDENKEDHPDGLSGAMQELHSALNSKDYKGAAEIFRAAFQLLDEEPHHEGEHI